MAAGGPDGDTAVMNPFRSVPSRQLIAVLALVGVGVLIGPPALASGSIRVPQPTLQRDWPIAVPVPAGTITGTTGVRPSETVGLLARGSVPQLDRRVVALYTSHGLRQAANGTLVFSSRTYRVIVSLRNHDHSASTTEVVVWLQTR